MSRAAPVPGLAVTQGRRLFTVLMMGLAGASCSGGGSSPSQGTDAARDGGAKDAPCTDHGKKVDRSKSPDSTPPGPDLKPAFSCSLPAVAPSLKPLVWKHPSAPLAGQTVTISLQSRIDPKPAKPETLTTTLVNAQGARQVTAYDVAGGKYWIYHIPVAGLSAGENCIVIRKGSQVEAALKVTAAPAQPMARAGGVWKVVSNHQRRCDEQPTYGNLLDVKVSDEKGQPVKGAQVRIRWTDDTVYPVPPDKSAMSWAAHSHPKSLTTGTDGKASLNTPWGTGIRTPIDAKPGYLMFVLDVQGGASDSAVEITTGIWEANLQSCNYCSKYGINVYGHWSYQVEFKKDPTATQVCEVGNDHAGQKACAYNHLYHDPSRPSCQPVQ